MSRRKRRDLSVFSLSFLDCISCGFGAIILLFVISLGSERLAIVDIRETLEQLYLERIDELDVLLDKKRNLIELIEKEKIEREGKLEKISFLQTEIDKFTNSIKKAKFGKKALLVNVNQKEKELDAREREIEIPQSESDLPIGVPVASDHLIFVIDTSGSMRDPSTGLIWKTITDKFEETLEVYPIVEAIQILDADGNWVIRTSNGEWLPDGPEIRRSIVRAIRTYNHHSQSNPVPGIKRAIRFAKPNSKDNADSKIGIYVFGDEFTQTADKVLSSIDDLNPSDEEGNRQVAINAIGFPNVVKYERHFTRTGLKFANLMRELTYIHGGAFIGNPD
jgi:hypothetical protein